MKTEVVFYFWLFTAFIPLVLSCICIAIVRLTLDRRVRQHLPKDKIYNSIWDAYFGIGRAIVFGYACAWPRVNNSPNIRPFYNDIDIKEFANRFEIIIGYTLTYSIATLAISLVVMTSLKLLGIYSFE